MPTRRTSFVLAAVLAALAPASLSLAAGKSAKPAPPPPPSPSQEARKEANAQKHGSEADVLLQAYVLLAAADHDYNGHRGKAMGATKAALDIVDHVAFHNGNVQQKIRAKQQESAAAQAKRAAKAAGTVHEPQAVSDAQLRAAAALLQEVIPSLATHKGKRALGHAENALKEIGIALRVR
jgi:hypothetical protein